MTKWPRVAVLSAAVVAVIGSTGLMADDASGSLPPNATKVSVHPGGTTAHINAALAAGSAISGMVTDSEANPLVSAQVVALTPSGRSMGYTFTDNTGNYRLTSLPASNSGYFVCVFATQAASSVRPVSYGYVSSCNGSTKPWSPNEHPPSDARRVPTQAGTTQTANMILTDAGAISGDITARGSGDKLQYAYAYAFDSKGVDVASAYTNDGTYQLKNLPPGTYRVCFEPPSVESKNATGYAPQCYKNHAWPDNGKPGPHALGVPVSADLQADADQSLPAAGAIAGTVRTATTPSHPTPEAFIDVYSHGQEYDSASPDEHGNYRLTNLPVGSYKVCAYRTNRILAEYARPADARTNPLAGPMTRAASPWRARTAEAAEAGSSSALQCWRHTAWSGSGNPPKKATVVHVHGHQTAKGIDFKLGTPKLPSTRITGHVTTRTGSKVAGAEVFAFRPSGKFVTEAAATKHGAFRLGVPRSSKSGYRVCAVPPRTLVTDTSVAKHPLGARCWKDVAWAAASAPTSGAVVHVASGKTHSGITIKLPQAGRIAGQVTFAGQPVPDVSVIVFDPHGQFVSDDVTDDDGEYVVEGVSPAQKKYEVCFATQQLGDPPTLSPDYGYRPQCFRNQPWNEIANY